MLSLIATALLTACGGGGGSSSPSQSLPLRPNSEANATASITFNVPKLSATNVGPAAALRSSASAAARNPQYLSPATDKISFLVDGAAVVDAAPVANFNNAGDGTGKFAFANGQSIRISYSTTESAAYYTVNAALTLVPGTHKFGVVILSGTPAYVLSEGQNTYAFQPGPNTGLAPLALRGVAATGYIECDTAAQNLDTTGTCNNYANFTPSSSGFGGTYSFTALVADYNGFPVAYQQVDGGPLGFDNGGFSVVESASDAPPVVSITSGGPFADPGSHLTGPSGGWQGTESDYHYGQPFSVTCVNVGTASLQLKLNGAGGTFNTPDGSPADTTIYPPSAVANGTLPLGSKTVVSPGRLPITNVTVNCTSTGTISLI